MHTGKNCLLSVVDVLLCQLGPVKPMAPAQVLSDERDGHGCLIGVQLGHVEVINKVDQLLCTRWTIVDTSLHGVICYVAAGAQHNTCHYM